MRLSFRKAIFIYILLPIIILFSVFAINNIFLLKREALQNIANHMTDLAISYAGIFDGFLKPIEGAAKITASLVEESEALTEEKLYKLLALQVENNPIIYGAAIAFMPNQFSSDKRLFAAYAYRKNGEIIRMDIAKQGYDYTDGTWEWWSNTVNTGQAAWSEPYFDKGAGNILMSTYAVPFYKNNELIGVATADIALDKVDNQIYIPGIKGQEIMVLSTTGKIIVHENEDEIGKSVYEQIERKFQNALLITGIEKKEDFDATKKKLFLLVESMLAGESGVVNLQYLGLDTGYWSFFAPIKSVGWSFSIRVKESDIFKLVYEQFWFSIAFFCLLLLMTVIAIVLVSGKFSRSLDGLIRRCERIERLNFQPTDNSGENIKEIRQLSHTLNKMSLVLGTHYSFKEDMHIAEAVRQYVVPKSSIEIEGYQIEIWSNAGGEHCGEMFDIMVCEPAQSGEQNTRDNIAFLLLDDADHGIDSAVKNGQLRAIFRTLIKQGLSLPLIAQQMNDYLISDMNLNGPVQLFLGRLDQDNATFSSISLGQSAVYHYSWQQQLFSQYTGHQQALAMQKNLVGTVVEQFTIAVGDVVVLVSDGVLGALSEQREQFGIKSLEQVVERQFQKPAEDILQSLQAALNAHTAESYLQTEQSIIVIKRC